MTEFNYLKITAEMLSQGLDPSRSDQNTVRAQWLALIPEMINDGIAEEELLEVFVEKIRPSLLDERSAPAELSEYDRQTNANLERFCRFFFEKTSKYPLPTQKKTWLEIFLYQ